MSQVRGLPPLLLLALGACDQVLGLTDRFPDAPPPDDPPVMVTGSVVRRWITNDAMGLPVSHAEPYPPGMIALAVHVGDASPMEVPVEADGSFSFVRSDIQAPYRLRIAAEGQRTEVQHTAARLVLGNSSLGRPNDQRTPVAQATYLVFPATGYPARVVSTGLWTTTVPSSNGLNYYVDWHTVKPASGRRGLLTQVHNDRLYFYDFTLPWSGPTTVRSYFEVGDVELMDGAYTPYAGPLTTAVPDLCAHLTGDREQEIARLTAATPQFKDPRTDWTIVAVPDLSFGAAGGNEIAFQDTSANPSDPTPESTVDTMVNFANPIRGSVLLATMGVTSTRLVQYPGALPVPMESSVRSYRPVTGDPTCASATDLTSSVAIPGAATFDGVLLAATDDAVVTPGLRETLTLTWPLASPGLSHRYAVLLYELSEDPASGYTTSRLLRDITTVEPTATIDAAVLVPGSHYLFVVAAMTGVPRSREGDLVFVEYPLEQAIMRTGVFRVD